MRLIVVTFAELARITALEQVCEGWDGRGERRFDEERWLSGLAEILGAGLVEEMLARPGTEWRLTVGESLVR